MNCAHMQHDCMVSLDGVYDGRGGYKKKCLCSYWRFVGQLFHGMG